MRVAILTLQSQNFGNRLQNFALQQVLEGEGHEVVTLKRSRVSVFGNPAKRMLRKVLKHDGTSRFLAFDDERIHFSRDVVEGSGFVTPDLAGHYDAFVIGSDQVWNPHFAMTGDNDYLPFVASDKKIAYATSFGVADIGVDGRARTAELLQGIPHISMREEAGAALVRDLIGLGCDVPVVLDPTMLLSKDAWQAIGVRPNIAHADGPFCLKHVIGDDAHAAAIDAMAMEYGLRIIDLHDQSLPVGPAEFVWLVNNANLLCTDSFHGSVFATLFHTPLAIFGRQGDGADMSSRFDTLCRIFGLEYCRVGGDTFSIERVLDKGEYARTDARLVEERTRSVSWLRVALAEVAARAL